MVKRTFPVEFLKFFSRDRGDDGPITSDRKGVPFPRGVDPYFWRIIVSGRFGARLVEVQDEWSLTDTEDAHAILNALENADGP